MSPLTVICLLPFGFLPLVLVAGMKHCPLWSLTPLRKQDPIGEFQKCLDDMVQEAREGGASEVAIFVSFDIDSIRASDCPVGGSHVGVGVQSHYKMISYPNL